MKPLKTLLTTLTILLFLYACKDVPRDGAEHTEGNKISLDSYLTGEGYVKLELIKMASGHLHIYGQLNGVRGNFILDTSAGATVIEEKSKDKFRMQTKESEQQATGAGGAGIQLQTSGANTLKIGKLELTEQHLILMNLDHVNKAFESMGLEKADGVIGTDILTNNKAIIDYFNLILYLKK